MILYHQPHYARQKEANFVRIVRERYPTAELRKESFALPDQLLKQSVSRDRLIVCMERDLLLPARAKQRSMKALSECPEDIFVVMNHQSISVDMVLVSNGVPIFFEFHERQHRRMSDIRLKKIYDRVGNAYEVPRGLQRLVRDVWRCLYLRPFCLVWSDWFEGCGLDFPLPIGQGFLEHALPGQFSFSEFLKSY